MQSPPLSPNAIRFGLFEADLSAGELRKRGRKIPLQDQPFRVLTLLLGRPGELISREEFQRALWPGDTFVEFDEGLNKAIQKLRQALDDSSGNPRFIETLPRKGYRFIAPVDRAAGEAVAAKAQSTLVDGKAGSTPTVGPGKRRSTEVLAWVLFGVVSVALVVLAGVYFRVFRPASQPTLRLTSSPADESAPAWSPDARYIAFCRHVSDHTEIWMIPALGGAERKLGEVAAQSGFCGLSWTPDGKYLALADKTAPQHYSIFLLSVETGDKRKLTSPPTEYWGDLNPRFSPDGKSLAFVRTYGGRSGEIYVLPVTDDGKPLGEPQRLTLDERFIFDLDWTSDGRRIVYSSGQEGSTNLFTVLPSGGAPERVAMAGENASALSISRSGNRLVYERDVWDTNIWRIPGPDSSDGKAAPSRFIASTQLDQEPQFSPGGTKIVFTSSRSGSYEIWVCDGEGRNPVQLTSSSGSEVGSPRWSPDSRWIAFDSSKAGKYDIYVISADGGQPRRLTSGPSNNVRPSWSQDGRWIYFGSTRSGDWQIWKEPAQGGAAVQVTKTKGAEEAFESLDGKSVYYAKWGAPGIWKVSVAGGEETQVLDRSGWDLWALSGQGISFFDTGDSTRPALKFYSFSTGKVALIRGFSKNTPGGGGTALTVSPDGRWILYTQLDQSGSNLVLVENFR